MSLLDATFAAATDLEDEPCQELIGRHVETLSPQNSIQNAHNVRFLKVILVQSAPGVMIYLLEFI